MITDKAGKQYWDDVWSEDGLPSAVNPYLKGVRNYINRRFHEYFLEAFSEIETSGMKLLEIGCAKSAWLPYFIKEFGFIVHGIDYSEIGCKKARQILRNEGLEGKILYADCLSPPTNMLNAYDVVVSFGVMEHFDDTVECTKAFSSFLKQNGIMITIIPNLCGLIGFVQKILNRKVFDIHAVLDRETLKRSHEISGLKVLDCDYFIFSNFSVLNIKGLRINSIEFFIKKNILRFLVAFSFMGSFFENKVGLFRGNKLLSTYIHCKSRKYLINKNG